MPSDLRAQTGQQRIAGRCTNGLIAIGPLELHTSRGEAIDVWRLHDLVAVTAEQRLQVIDADEQDIRAVGSKCHPAETG